MRIFLHFNDHLCHVRRGHSWTSFTIYQRSLNDHNYTHNHNKHMPHANTAFYPKLNIRQSFLQICPWINRLLAQKSSLPDKVLFISIFSNYYFVFRRDICICFILNTRNSAYCFMRTRSLCCFDKYVSLFWKSIKCSSSTNR